MRTSSGNIFKQLDWWSIVLYIALLTIGWVSIYASEYNPDGLTGFTASRHQMQLIWIGTAWLLAIALLSLPAGVYEALSWIIYGLGLLGLVVVLVFGVERGGSRSWLLLGPVQFQPAETAKVFISLALASFMSHPQFKLRSLRGILGVGALIIIPAALILLEHETGLALVLLGLSIMLYREGMSGWILILGIVAIALFILTILCAQVTVFWTLFILCALVCLLLASRKLHVFVALLCFCAAYFGLPALLGLFGVDLWAHLSSSQWFLLLFGVLAVYLIIQSVRHHAAYLRWVALVFGLAVGFSLSVGYIIENVLQPHQRSRIEVLLGIKTDIYNAGYNVHQSKVAIGSGGFSGKGFLKGTQTKFDFVPEQSTDFIFCTIGEEWGFLGASLVVLLYLALIARIVQLAERQKFAFGRIYGYCVASCFFMHCFINMGMTIGLVPVIGIPLPFMSYGGSSLWTFTVLLFILLQIDAKQS